MAPHIYLYEAIYAFAPQDSISHGDEAASRTFALARRLEPQAKPQSADGLVLEAWAQGYMVGSLIIMAAITVANMRRGVLLHKLILLELILGTFHGTFIFNHPPVYDWYLSVTAIFLNISWSLHNVIAWLKTKPFLSRRWSLFYIGTVILAQPYWVLEIYANFAYFNGYNTIFQTTRPYEALFRDPWWIFSILNLFWNIHTSYHLPLPTILRLSPRFGVLIAAMLLSVGFLIVDIVSVTNALNKLLPDGLNPFWKLSFVFKCLTDSIILDDFKTALDKLMRFKMQKESFGTLDTSDEDTAYTTGSTAFAAGDSGSTGIEDTEMQGQPAQNLSFLDALRDPRPDQPKQATTTTTTNKQRPEDPLSEDAIEQDRLNEAQARIEAGKLKPLNTTTLSTEKRSSVAKGPHSPGVESCDEIYSPAFASTGEFGTGWDRDNGSGSVDDESSDDKSPSTGATWHEHAGQPG